MEKGKEMDIRDAELIVDEEVEIKSEPVDDENDVQFVTDVVKEQTRPAIKKNMLPLGDSVGFSPSRAPPQPSPLSIAKPAE